MTPRRGHRWLATLFRYITPLSPRPTSSVEVRDENQERSLQAYPTSALQINPVPCQHSRVLYIWGYLRHPASAPRSRLHLVLFVCSGMRHNSWGFCSTDSSITVGLMQKGTTTNNRTVCKTTRSPAGDQMHHQLMKRPNRHTFP